MTRQRFDDADKKAKVGKEKTVGCTSERQANPDDLSHPADSRTRQEENRENLAKARGSDRQ